MLQHLFSSVISVAVVIALAIPQGWVPSARADDEETARFYVRLPLGGAREAKPRLGFSLNFQPDERAATADLHLQLPAIQLELSVDGVEQARFFGFDAKLAYDYAYGNKGGDGGEATLPALLLYSMAGGIAGALLTACLIEWCSDDDRNVIIINSPTTSAPPTNPGNSTPPVTPATPVVPPIGGNPSDPPVTPVTAA